MRTSPVFVQLFEDMDPERGLTVQLFQLCQPLHAGLWGFPAVGGHAEQGLNVRRTFQMEEKVHRDNGLIGKALVGRFLFLVGIGGVVEHLLQLPQMPGPRHHIEEGPARFQDPAEFVHGQGGKAVQQYVGGVVREGQVVAGGHREFDVLFPFGGQSQDEFGDVDACHPGRFSGGAQGAVNAGGVVALAAACIQNHRIFAGKGQNSTTKRI